MDLLAGKTLISVDIQPEYSAAFRFSIEEYCEFLNENANVLYKLIFLYNGKDTLGMISEDDYKMWLTDAGLSEEVLNWSTFYDKGYAFFRYCMDESIDETVISNFVRFLYSNNIHDSREMTREMWAKYLRQYRRTDKKELYELMKSTDDCIHIPDLMDFLKNKRDLVLTGGGINACLKEVEIALNALNIPYKVFNKYTY